MNELIKQKLSTLPETPGVYIMKDKDGVIIYIGKAVVLKNRVRQYFFNTQKQLKVQLMVEHIEDFDYMITLTEKDALALENNLIKKHKPHYNILLKDDKAYPYIKIDMKSEFPTLEVVRRVVRDNAKYFGPFMNGIYVWDVVGIIKSAYGMRACPKKLPVNKRPCLNYDIKLCHAPCCKLITREQYAEIVSRVTAFLSGREDTAEKNITAHMQAAVEAEEFERAIKYREQLKMLKLLKERSVANLGKVLDIDAIAYRDDGELAAVSIAVIRGGKMMGAKNYSVSGADLSDQDALAGFLAQYYSSSLDVPSEICLEKQAETEALSEFISALGVGKATVFAPDKGVKRKLVEMAAQNAEYYLAKSADTFKRRKAMTETANENLKELLGLKKLRRIECFDISNISGTFKVASCVVFIDGEKAPYEYRKFKIKTVEGANDFECIKEVVSRRLMRAADDEKFSELADLMVIDGGKGQLLYAGEAMKEAGYDIPMISLAEKNEEIYTTSSPLPIVLSKSDDRLKLLIRLRDEAHRFALTYYKKLHVKSLKSQLLSIEGVGDKKCKILLEAFENIEDLKKASTEQLAAVKGIDKTTAQKVYEFYRHTLEKE